MMSKPHCMVVLDGATARPWQGYQLPSFSLCHPHFVFILQGSDKCNGSGRDKLDEHDMARQLRD